MCLGYPVCTRAEVRATPADELPNARAAVPVIVLTGYLGVGKTSVLNHLLRHPVARIGFIVNDFAELNVDAGLISGQVDEPVSNSGGCICCLTEAGGTEDALIAMAEPALALDAILVEASGFAEPLILARISRWGRSRFRLGRLIDVIDACEHFTTIDDGDLPRSARPRSPSPLLTSSTSSPTPSASRVWPSSASVCMPAIRGPRRWAQCSAASNRTCSSTCLLYTSPSPRD